MKQDIRWENFAVPSDFDSFCLESIPRIELKNEVPQDVKNSFRIVQRLLEHSYYEYEFYDAAALKAMFTFEMAVKIRYKELTGDDWHESLAQLIRWFEKQNYFEVYNKHFLEHYRTHRNRLAHPINHMISGPLARQWILHTMDLVNSLYESNRLRYYRKNVTMTLLNKLFELRAKGFIVKTAKEDFLSFEISLAFINNKITPQEMYFYFKPLFPLPKDFEKGVIYNSPIFYFTANSFKIFTDSIQFATPDGDITIKRIDSDFLQQEFDNWSVIFNDYANQTGERAMWNTKVSEYFETHLRQFHNS